MPPIRHLYAYKEAVLYLRECSWKECGNTFSNFQIFISLQFKLLKIYCIEYKKETLNVELCLGLQGAHGTVYLLGHKDPDYFEKLH